MIVVRRTYEPRPGGGGLAKHLKDGKLKEAISTSTAKKFRYSHLGKVVLAGLQEFQFQQDFRRSALSTPRN